MHWFDVRKAKNEFQRILKPGGRIVLAWNERDQSNDFQKAYERLLCKYLPSYNQKIKDDRLQSKIEFLFKPEKVHTSSIPNPAFLDFPSLIGRLHSSSFCPPKDSNTYKNVLHDLQSLFDCFQQEGTINFDYRTNIFWS